MTHYIVHTHSTGVEEQNEPTPAPDPMACDSKQFVFFRTALMMNFATSNTSAESDKLLRKRCALHSVQTLNLLPQEFNPLSLLRNFVRPMTHVS